MKLWKRNAVVAAIVLFVCVAVYLNWSYNSAREAGAEGVETGKTLGEAALVDGVTIMGRDTPESEEHTAGGGKDANAGGSGYFANARLNRQQARDTSLTLLQTAASDEAADQEVVNNANQSIQTMAAWTSTESQIENLVIAKGYTDCVAFLSENSVSVVVSPPEGGLTAADTARITDIVLTETGLSAGQVKIIEAN